jgi:hypothetical protein
MEQFRSPAGTAAEYAVLEYRARKDLSIKDWNAHAPMEIIKGIDILRNSEYPAATFHRFFIRAKVFRLDI